MVLLIGFAAKKVGQSNKNQAKRLPSEIFYDNWKILA